MAYDKLTAHQLGEAVEGGLINESVLQTIMNANRDKDLELMTRANSGTHDNLKNEWTIDAIAPASSTDADLALVSGQDITGNEATIGFRTANRTQTSGGRISVSYAAEESDNIGRGSELGYQSMKYSLELERKIQRRAYANLPSVIGDPNVGTDTAEETAGIEAQIGGVTFVPIDDQGAGGWTGTVGDANSTIRQVNSAGTIAGGGINNQSAGVIPAWTYTTVTPGVLTETALRDVVQARWNTVGQKTTLAGMNRGPVNRLWSEYSFSSTSRIATEVSDRRDGSRSPRTSEGSSNVFVSDFGVIEFVPENEMDIADSASGSDTLFLLDLDYIEISRMWGMRGERQAKLGISDQWQLTTAWQCNVLDPQRQCMVQGIDASLPMTFA
jgi:hypothetical protein